VRNIRLAMEIPTAFLKEWSKLCDFDFVLAHKVLESEEYAKFFSDRPRGRKLIMDNSMHELGHPLSAAELLEAAKRCRADYVIAPDKLKEVEQNYTWFKETHRLLGTKYKIAAVLCGNDLQERIKFLGNVRHASMICLPYREPRYSWFREQIEFLDARWADSIHLLGVNELAELWQWQQEPTFNFSIDTAKPIKWGLLGKSILTEATLRGAPISSAELLNLKTTSAEQRAAIFYNVAALRTML